MIEINSISKKFDSKDLFKEFSLFINKHEKVILKGTSGCGKSTLLKILCGFESIQSGNIKINHLILNNKNLFNIRKSIGYMGQKTLFLNKSFYNLIIETLQFNSNSSLKYNEPLVLSLMQQFNLNPILLSSPMEHFSGGERQRAALILLFLLKKKIWLLDEISSGLDTTQSKLILDFIKEQKITLLAISHDPLWHKQKGFTLIKWNQHESH